MLLLFLTILCVLVFGSGKEARMRPLVLKQLHGHRGRNSKTAIMFTTSMAFIIFAGAMFTLQANSIGDNLRQAFGADIIFTVRRTRNSFLSLIFSL